MELFVRHAMCALMPPVGDVPGLCDTDVRAYVSRLHRESSTTLWLGILAGTLLFVVMPIVTVYLPLPSFLLPAKLLDRHATRIATTRVYLFRQAIFLLKMGAGMGWGADPAVRARFALAPLAADPDDWRTS